MTADRMTPERLAVLRKIQDRIVRELLTELDAVTRERDEALTELRVYRAARNLGRIERGT